MAEAVGEDFAPAIFHPELLDASADRRLEVLPIAICLDPDHVGDAGIIRVGTGIARTGQLDAYVDEAHRGTLRDRAAATGPRALYLAVDRPERFVTPSL
jgi:hypothetical protein